MEAHHVAQSPGMHELYALMNIGIVVLAIFILGRKSIPEESWLGKMLARKPKMLVAIALANKMARTIWAMLTKETDYRDPTISATA